jgi:hypothetical protein
MCITRKIVVVIKKVTRSVVIYLSCFIFSIFTVKYAFGACTLIYDESYCGPESPNFGCFGPSEFNGKGICNLVDSPKSGFVCNNPAYVNNSSNLKIWECQLGDPCPCGGGGDDGCFLANTKISTTTGQKDIEEIKDGDMVLSFDPTTRKISENTVASVIKTTKPSYFEITTKSGRVIKATAEHPFYVGQKQEFARFPLVKISNLIDTIKQLFAKIANK